MKNECAMQMENCYYYTIGYRGICSRCYGKLVELGIIHTGDRFSDFPLWLKEFIRLEDAQHHKDVRHPKESYEDYEDQLRYSERPTETHIPLGEGCRKLRNIDSYARIR